MQVILHDETLDPFMSYLESVLSGDTVPMEDHMLNAIASCILSNRNVDDLLSRYRKGHVSELEIRVAELYLDECIGITLTELANDFHASVARQLKSKQYHDLRTNRGFIIVRVRG